MLMGEGIGDVLYISICHSDRVKRRGIFFVLCNLGGSGFSHPRARYFSYNSKRKVPKRMPPLHPALRVPSHFNFANGSVQLASMLDEPHNSSLNCDPTKVKALGKVNGIQSQKLKTQSYICGWLSSVRCYVCIPK